MLVPCVNCFWKCGKRRLLAIIWNWFLIGYKRCKKDDDKMLTYTRVYGASKMKMSAVPAKKKIREAFQDVVE